MLLPRYSFAQEAMAYASYWSETGKHLLKLTLHYLFKYKVLSWTWFLSRCRTRVDEISYCTLLITLLQKTTITQGFWAVFVRVKHSYVVKPTVVIFDKLATSNTDFVVEPSQHVLDR